MTDGCVIQCLMDMQLLSFLVFVCSFDGWMGGWMDGWMDARCEVKAGGGAGEGAASAAIDSI